MNERLDKIASLLIEVSELWGRTYASLKEIKKQLDQLDKERNHEQQNKKNTDGNRRRYL